MATFQNNHLYPSFYKSEVRAAFYARVIDPNKYHIVIVGDSETGFGDITYLIDHGVAANRIVACDRNNAVLEEANRMGCLIPPDRICNDILLTSDWAIKKFGLPSIASINVDLCGAICDTALFLRSVLDMVGDKVPVSYTFLRGRDKGFSSTAQRMQELRSYVSLSETYLKEYQSRSIDNSSGSPMATVFYNTNIDLVEQEMVRETATNKRLDRLETMVRHLASMLSARLEVPLPNEEPFYKAPDFAAFTSSATTCDGALKDAIRYLMARDGQLPKGKEVILLVSKLAKWSPKTIDGKVYKVLKTFRRQRVMSS